MERTRQTEEEINVTNSCREIDTHAATAVSPLSVHSRAWNSNRCICGKNTAPAARADFFCPDSVRNCSLLGESECLR